MKARVRGTCILLQFVRWRLSFVQCWCPWLQSMISFPLQVRWISLGFSIALWSSFSYQILLWDQHLVPLCADSSLWFPQDISGDTGDLPPQSWYLGKCHVNTALTLQFCRRELGALYSIYSSHFSTSDFLMLLVWLHRAHSCPSECARRNHISGDIEFLGFNCHSFSAWDVKM